MKCRDCGSDTSSQFHKAHSAMIPRGAEFVAIRGNKSSTERKRWDKYRRQWFINHPPNWEGYYECYLCHKWIVASMITLDHVIPRSRDITLKYEDANIKPCCWSCNNQKGSKVLDNK